MPDAAGRFLGVSVPRIPWHEPTTDDDPRIELIEDRDLWAAERDDGESHA